MTRRQIDLGRVRDGVRKSTWNEYRGWDSYVAHGWNLLWLRVGETVGADAGFTWEAEA